MNNLETLLFKRFVGPALLRPCPLKISRSGPDGEAVNCFAVELQLDPPQWVSAIEDDGIRCHHYENGSQIDTTLRFSAVEARQIRIVHYRGLSEVECFGLWDFVRSRTTRWPYMALWADQVGQWFFNRRSLVSAQQTMVLRALYDDMESGSGYRGTTYFQLCENLATRRYWKHPGGGAFRNKIQLYLDSCVAMKWAINVSGDSQRYRITGHGMAELERRDEEERKHTASQRLQWALWFVAVVSALSAIVQANIVRVPTILDFSTDVKAPQASSEERGQRAPPGASVASAPASAPPSAPATAWAEGQKR
ncbi:hypothetical protein H5407_13905 [Mitsuaria sp. WAJ17]|uniref:hypothetical protein n=1 Tax=Mitsuaria sp. WAJ17 TaxID=2761452 RepID=UPI0015FEE1DA|nr:hypothetical protein [Mitsuaria sp. WAJ17]MBB2486313.1 hypothetical protein [Mitsuaria sp. WAJ17]